MTIGKRKTLPITLSIIFILLSWGAYFLLNSNDYHRSILVGGSSTVHAYTLALAEEFIKGNKGTSIYCESGGSTPGLIAVKNGAIDIAVMSRDLEDDEDDKYIKNYLIGKDGLGIIVHPSNPVANLTVEQVRDIFSGAIDNWSIFGGSDSNIIVVGRNPDSTTYKGLADIVLKGAKFKENAIIADSAEKMLDEVISNPDAIGFLALKDLDDNVKVLDINGVHISRETILTDRYPISRSFYFTVYDKPDNSIENKNQDGLLDKILGAFTMDDDKVHQLKIEAVMSFIDFVQSAKGQEIIENHGAIAVY
ncbi:MAG: phosphate ABC transporter substrate-binding protein [Clostridiaceae bacterium]|nr:phosphate ABC transporter substrate-binding protein [Clostridiaceae bacterium]